MGRLQADDRAGDEKGQTPTNGGTPRDAARQRVPADHRLPSPEQDREKQDKRAGGHDKSADSPRDEHQQGDDSDVSDGKSRSEGEDDEGDDEKGGAKDDKKDQPKKPPLYRRPAFWIVIGVLLIVGVVVGLLWFFDWRFKVSTDDAFISAHNTTVSSRVAGHIVKVLVDDNQEVKKDDLLVQLDDHDFKQAVISAQASLESAQAQLVQAQAQVASAKASVAQAQADVSSAEASAKQAEADRDRYHSVLKIDPRAVSQQQVDQADANARTTAAQLSATKEKAGAAQAQVKVAEAQIVAAGAMIDKAKSDLDNANLQLSYTQVHAAESGRVTGRSAEVGNYVTPGQSLMAVVPPEVYVIANYKETQLRKVREGDRVKIHIDTFDIDLPGHVQSIQSGSGAAFSLLPPENATGNYVKVVQRIPVKIVFDRVPEQRLSPGMSVEPTVDIRRDGE